MRLAITDAVADTASLRTAKRQECSLDLDHASLTIVADGGRIRQILFNLLSNASKFTPEGGQDLPGARCAPGLRCAQPADRAGDRARMVPQEVVWVSVADEGIGIKREDMPKLFQEFSQVDSSPSRRAQGTGLGLALCRSSWRCTAGPSAPIRSSARVRRSGFYSRLTARYAARCQASYDCLMRARLIRVKASLLLAVFLAAGTSLPSLDALVHHQNSEEAARSQAHVESAGGCPSHAGHCGLGRGAPGSGAGLTVSRELRLQDKTSVRQLPPPLVELASAVLPASPSLGLLQSGSSDSSLTGKPRTGRTSMRALVLAAALAAVAPAIAAAADPPPHSASTLTGRVTDTTGTPLAQVRVTVLEVERSTTTDASGRYRLEDLPTGTYAVSFALVGYAPQVRRVTLARRARRP